MNIDPDTFAALDEASADVGCAAGFEVLHRYVEAKLAGGVPERELPGVAVHLRRCPACRADYEGLLVAVTEFGDDAPT